MIDNLLTVIRKVKQVGNVKEHWLLDAFRRDLMNDDLEGFWQTYNSSAAHNTDDFDFIVQEMFDVVGATDIGEFVEKVEAM